VTASSPALQLVGAVLNGRWRLQRLLGEGGMGAVYEAESTRGEGKRAIKLLHQEFVKEDQILQRFYAEAQATRALSHPNISQVFDSGTAEDGTPYLVMELLQGMPLASYLESNTAVPPAHAVPIVYGVLQALTVAHNQRIVHRDLKPDNLFLVRDQAGNSVVKVLDFGIAKVMDAAGGMGQKTRTGVLLGTPGYMSPEQIKNSKGVDPRSDLWSVGIILYEMLTAKQPFPADNEFARLTAVLTEDVKPIEQVAPQLTAWAPFFRRALAKEPAQRFQTADEMAQGMMAAFHGVPAQQPQQQQPATQPQGPPATAQGMGPRPGQFGTVPSMQAVPQMGMPASQVLPAQAPQAAYPTPQPMSQPMSYSPPTPMPMNVQPGPMAGMPGGSVPTHVSGIRPAGTPTVSSHVPQIDIIQPHAPASKGAAWWIVGVVAFVAFGLGLAVGLVVGG
jgi:eukaryotic-like serine/threonine-protein kinase